MTSVKHMETGRIGRIIGFDGFASYLIDFDNGEQCWLYRSELFTDYSLTKNELTLEE